MANCKYVGAGYQVGPGEKLFSMGETCVPDRPIIVCPSEGGSMPPEWEAGCGIPPIGTDPGEVTALVPISKELAPTKQSFLPGIQPPEAPGFPGSYPGGGFVNGDSFLPGIPGGGWGPLFDWPDVNIGFPPLWPPQMPMPTPQPPMVMPSPQLPSIVVPGRVVMDACGRCFIERDLPARKVRRRGRIVMGPNGPACMPAPRRMNALNPRALSRALRRAQKFAKFAKKAVRISTGLKMKRGFRAPRKSKAKACCPK